MKIKEGKGRALDQVHLPRSNTLVILQVANLAFNWVEIIKKQSWPIISTNEEANKKVNLDQNLF